MNKLRIAYFGTPQFSADFLKKLLTDKKLSVEVVFVVTQPDRRVGRKQILTPSPVKVVAEKYNIPVFDNIVGVGSSDPNNGRDNPRVVPTAKMGERTSPLRGIDLAVLYAYGAILPPEVLEAPKRGFINIHPSLLPRYRGVSPTAFPLILGDKLTGISLIKLDNKIDHGPLYDQAKLTIDPKINRSLLEGQLTSLAFAHFSAIITRWGSIHLAEQDHPNATYTLKLKKNDGFLSFDLVQRLLTHEALIPADLPQLISKYCEKNNAPYPAPSPLLFYNLFRGLSPWPGIWTTILVKGERKRLKITDVSFENNHFSISKVQLEGKKEVDFETFQKAYTAFKIRL